MERIAVDNLPEGSTLALEKKALTRGFKKKNGKPNVSELLRYLVAREIKVK